MIEFENLDVELSEAMKQRIAQGDVVAADEGEIKCKTGFFFLYLTSHEMQIERPDGFTELKKMIANGVIDSGAILRFREGHRDVKMPLLHALIRYVVLLGHESEKSALVQWVVNQVPADTLDEDKIPAYHRAYHTMRHVMWDMMVQKPDFDIERRYPAVHPPQVGGMGVRAGQAVSYPPIPAQRYEATLLEHECINAQRQTSFMQRFSPDHIKRGLTAKLMPLRPAVAPEYLDWIEDGPEIRTKWEELWSEFRQAISQQDRPKIDAFLEQKILQCGFALGHGSEMCSKEFWGTFWDVGRAAVMALPQWVQQRLAPDIIVMLQDAMPRVVVGEWCHEAPIRQEVRR